MNFLFYVLNVKILEKEECTPMNSTYILTAYHISDILKITIINNLVNIFANWKAKCPKNKNAVYSKNINCYVEHTLCNAMW